MAKQEDACGLKFPAVSRRTKPGEHGHSSLFGRVACAYFGEGLKAARAEFDSYYKKPLTEMGFYARVSFKHILDLEDATTRKHFGLSDRDFTRSYVTLSGDLIPLQSIGLAVSQQTKVAAIRFPSHAILELGKTGFNVVVFQHLITPPDNLEIMEDDIVVERWPKT